MVKVLPFMLCLVYICVRSYEIEIFFDTEYILRIALSVYHIQTVLAHVLYSIKKCIYLPSSDRQSICIV